MRSILTVSIFGIALALGGCAAHTTEPAGAEETDEALSALDERLVGAYRIALEKGNFEEYDTLTLDASGRYTAEKPSPTKGPDISEIGSWRASGGRLLLIPSRASAKRYDVALVDGGSEMTLTRAGRTELLDRVLTSTCSSDRDCPRGEECHAVPVCPDEDGGGVRCQALIDECVDVAQEGESCGFRTQSIDCARGLDCRHAPGTPLDALTCLRPLAQYGEPCGGFVARPVECGDGLACSHVGADGRLINPDLPGVCLAGEGSSCGGTFAGAHACASPLRCESSNPDIGGVCVE